MKTFKLTLTATLVASALSAMATDFQLSDDITASVKGTATLGTMLRMDDPSPNAYTYVTSQSVGLPAGNLIGLTNSSDVNFKKNAPVSTVLKAVLDLDLHGKDAGLFLRAYGWTDPELANAGRPYGSYANGYQAGSALSDSGFAPEAKFSNVLIRDAYVYKRFQLDQDSSVQAKLGRQTLDWGKSMLTTGGINSAVNAMDYAASTRPGALPEEGKLATAMLSASLAQGKNWGADGFVKLENVTPAYPGCGTFFDSASLIPSGCNLAGAISNTIPGSPLGTPLSLSEPALFNSGYYVHRGTDINPSASGQWGLSLKYLAESVNTEFRGYAMNTSSNTPGFHIYTPTVALSTTGPITSGPLAAAPATMAAYNRALNSLSNPNGLKYSVGYAQDVQLYGLSFDTKLSPLSRVFGELAVRPNAQMNWNGNDLLAAALLPGQLLSNYKGVNTLATGGSYDAWDRLAVSTLTLGGSKVFPAVLGAERVVLLAEFGLSHVDGLPDPLVMRYGRAFSYGSAPYLLANGTLAACSEAVAANGVPKGVVGKTCTTDGFVTTDAIGIRMNLSARYPNAVGTATLTPALYVASDISGYSYDGSYSQGRLVLRPSLKVEWGKDWYMDVAYTSITGGAYNLAVDKGNLVVAAGLKF